jgi:hypothetical protein
VETNRPEESSHSPAPCRSPVVSKDEETTCNGLLIPGLGVRVKVALTGVRQGSTA